MYDIVFLRIFSTYSFIYVQLRKNGLKTKYFFKNNSLYITPSKISMTAHNII